MATVEEPVTRFTLDNFPVQLQRRIKSTAALRGISMKEAMVEAAKGWLEQNEAGHLSPDDGTARSAWARGGTNAAPARTGIQSGSVGRGW